MVETTHYSASVHTVDSWLLILGSSTIINTVTIVIDAIVTVNNTVFIHIVITMTIIKVQ